MKPCQRKDCDQPGSEEGNIFVHAYEQSHSHPQGREFVGIYLVTVPVCPEHKKECVGESSDVNEA